MREDDNVKSPRCICGYDPEIKRLRKHIEDIEKRLAWSREDADMARIYMTKWQMRYEEELARSTRWRSIAERLSKFAPAGFASKVLDELDNATNEETQQ